MYRIYFFNYRVILACFWTGLWRSHEAPWPPPKSWVVSLCVDGKKGDWSERSASRRDNGEGNDENVFIILFLVVHHNFFVWHFWVSLSLQETHLNKQGFESFSRIFMRKKYFIKDRLKHSMLYALLIIQRVICV